MAIFSIIESDERVQLGEKIRFDCKKSFVTKGATAISTMTVIPEDDISAIDIYNADDDERYLDWVYLDFEVDIDATNNKLDFSEDGSTELTATISSGTYSLSTLASEIKTQLDSAGANTYTVSYSNDKITIASTGNLELNKTTGSNKAVSILPMIGFPSRTDTLDTGLKTSHTGKRTEYLTRKITLTTGDGSGTHLAYRYVNVYSKDGDALFSSDSDLKASEPDIMNYLGRDRSSYNFIHREAQELITAYLDEKGLVDIYGDKFTKAAFVSLDEFKQWSKFMVLRLIFEGLSNSLDDEFDSKAKKYRKEETYHSNRAVVRIDIDADGQIDTFEDVRQGTTGRVVRR